MSNIVEAFLFIDIEFIEIRKFMIKFLLLIACIATVSATFPSKIEGAQQDNRRESMDLRRSTFDLPRYREGKVYVCSLCKRALSVEMMAPTSCGHPCCFNCFDAPIPLRSRCGICKRLLHDMITGEEQDK